MTKEIFKITLTDINTFKRQQKGLTNRNINVKKWLVLCWVNEMNYHVGIENNARNCGRVEWFKGKMTIIKGRTAYIALMTLTKGTRVSYLRNNVGPFCYYRPLKRLRQFDDDVYSMLPTVRGIKEITLGKRKRLKQDLDYFVPCNQAKKIKITM